MLRAFITQGGNIDIAGQYRERGSQLEEIRQRTGHAHVNTSAPRQAKPHVDWAV